jgi:hypothetical protein
MSDSTRFITTWRKPADPLTWDHHVSEDQREVETVVANLLSQGVKQYHTYRLGEALPDLSSAY